MVGHNIVGWGGWVIVEWNGSWLDGMIVVGHGWSLWVGCIGSWWGGVGPSGMGWSWLGDVGHNKVGAAPQLWG